MRFFADNCISPTYVRAIRVLAEVQKYEIVHLRERFSPATADVDWIRALGSEADWVIISGDPRISRSKGERAAWHESGLTAFFFADGWASKSFWKQAEDMVHWWPDVVLTARETVPGSGYLIPVKGKNMRQVYDPRHGLT